MYEHKTRLQLEELESRTLLSSQALAHSCLVSPAHLGATAVRSARPTPVLVANAAPTTAARDMLSGFEISPGIISGSVRYGATFIGRAAGTLPGVWGVSINYTPPHPGPSVVNTIVGGFWTVAAFSSGTFEGIIYGAVVPGGTVTWNAAGTVADISANLTVLGGTGLFVGVTGGGTFTGTLSHLTFPPTITGALTLSFSP